MLLAGPVLAFALLHESPLGLSGATGAGDEQIFAMVVCAGGIADLMRGAS
jgi:hypothetical protein